MMDVLEKGLAEDKRKEKLRHQAQMIAAESIVKQIEHKKRLQRLESVEKKKVCSSYTKIIMKIIGFKA